MWPESAIAPAHKMAPLFAGVLVKCIVGYGLLVQMVYSCLFVHLCDAATSKSGQFVMQFVIVKNKNKWASVFHVSVLL